MKSDEQPQNTQEQIMMISHRWEIKTEDDKRRQCTRLGYRLGGRSGLTISMMAPVFITAIAVICLAVMAPSLDIQIATSPWLWLCFAPLTIIPIAPFLFLKMHYALKVLVFVLAVLMTVGLLTLAGLWAMRHIVNALI